jgi:hypothetical protein
MHRLIHIEPDCTPADRNAMLRMLASLPPIPNEVELGDRIADGEWL